MLVFVVVLVTGLVADVSAHPDSPPAEVAQKKAKKRKLLPACRHGQRPRVHGKRRCVRVPRNASRPRGRGQQGGPDDLVPEPKGSGLGAATFNREETAIEWAKAQRADGARSRYAWYCQAFVENAFNVSDKFKSAARAAEQLELHKGDPPRGALVFFRPDRTNQRLGHVGIALDKDTMISALNVVTVSPLHQEYWADRYAGWAYAPEDWPGRFEAPEQPAPDLTPGPGAGVPAVQFTSPAADSTLSGVATFTAHADNANAVEFHAYYADNPANVNTLGWHKLGTANTSGGGDWSMPYDTHAIPDQGDGALGTVNLMAVVVDGSGALTSAREYRRVNVSNPVTPAPTPTPAPAPTRRVITVDNRVTNAGGMREDTTPARLTTQPWIRCGSRGCNINGTERSSGGTYDAAVCQTTGERTTNGNDGNANDDANPERFESTRYYGVRLGDGTYGFVSEVWIRAADRGGLGLPGC
jgi:hypothetical protein